MSPPNGHANGSFGSSDQHSTPLILSLNANSTTQYTATQIKEFVALLKVPFDPGVIEWRVPIPAKETGSQESKQSHKSRFGGSKLERVLAYQGAGNIFLYAIHPDVV